MNILTYIILIFSLLGALDRIFNNRFGLGKEFEKGFILFGSMALSMIGMISIAPFIADMQNTVYFSYHKPASSCAFFRYNSIWIDSFSGCMRKNIQRFWLFYKGDNYNTL